MHSDYSLLDSTATGTSHPTVQQITPNVSAAASPKGADCVGFPPQHGVGTGLQAETLTDSARELAICKASDLVELFHAESRCMEALWRQHGDFTHKAAFDLAYSNCHKARELMESLMRGRKQEALRA